MWLHRISQKTWKRRRCRSCWGQSCKKLACFSQPKQTWRRWWWLLWTAWGVIQELWMYLRPDKSNSRRCLKLRPCWNLLGRQLWRGGGRGFENKSESSVRWFGSYVGHLLCRIKGIVMKIWIACRSWQRLMLTFQRRMWGFKTFARPI